MSKKYSLILVILFCIGCTRGRLRPPSSEGEAWEEYLKESSRPVKGLLLKVRVENEVVKTNEDIRLEVRLCNVGSEDIYIPLGQGELKLSVYDPDTATFLLRPRKVEYEPGRFIKYVRIPPGCFYGMWVPILLSRNPIPAGVYSVRFSYENYIETGALSPEAPSVRVRFWTGKCHSTILEVRVKKGRLKP